MTIFTWENFFVLALIRAYLIIISVDYSVVEESQKKFSAVWREGGGRGLGNTLRLHRNPKGNGQPFILASAGQVFMRP